MAVAVENIPVDEAVEVILQVTGVVVTGRTSLTRNLLPRAQHSGLVEPRDARDHRHKGARHIVERPHVVISGQMTGVAMVGDRFPEFLELGHPILGLVSRNNRGVNRSNGNAGHPVRLDSRFA